MCVLCGCVRWGGGTRLTLGVALGGVEKVRRTRVGRKAGKKMLPHVGVCCVYCVCVCVSRLTFVLTFDVKRSFRVCVCVRKGNPPPFNVKK